MNKEKMLILSGLVLFLCVTSSSKASEWELLNGELNIPAHGLTGEALNGYIYAIGGVITPGSPSNAQNAVSKYDPNTDNWSLVVSMPTARHSLSSAVIDGWIYAVCGHVSNSRSENQRYNGTSWESKASVYARSGPGVAAGCDGKLYVFGGNHYSTILSRFDIYDPTTNTWSYGGEMPAATEPWRAVTLNCKIYLTAGGHVDAKKVWCYDPVADIWDTSIPLMNAERSCCELQVVNGRIYAIGGANSSDGYLSSVESWAPGELSWRMEPSLNVVRSQFASAVIANDIYVFGGYGGSDLGSTEVLRAVILVDIDIKPGSCPNPLNVKSKGVLPVAILGSEDFDVNSVDPASVRLAGIAPVRSSLEDVAAPQEEPSCINGDCHEFTTDSNTVALWHLNGDGNDDSGNNYHLVAHPTNPNAVSWESGSHCDGHAVMGEDDYSGSCWNSTSAALTAPGSGCTYPGSGDWTVEAWVLFPSNSESYLAVSHYSKHWAGHDPYHLGVSNGQAYFQFEETPGNPVYISGDVSAYVGQWIHIAGVYRYRQDAALYVNGVQVAYQATTWAPEYLPGYDVFVGGCYCGTSTDLKVDEVRISDTARYVYCHEEPNECECTTEGPDSYIDLTLKFKTQDIVSVIGEVSHGGVLPLTLEGVLFDERPIEGADCIVIRGKHKPLNEADINKDGVVNSLDFAVVAENWLQ